MAEHEHTVVVDRWMQKILRWKFSIRRTDLGNEDFAFSRIGHSRRALVEKLWPNGLHQYWLVAITHISVCWQPELRRATVLFLNFDVNSFYSCNACDECSAHCSLVQSHRAHTPKRTHVVSVCAAQYSRVRIYDAGNSFSVDGSSTYICIGIVCGIYYIEEFAEHALIMLHKIASHTRMLWRWSIRE